MGRGDQTETRTRKHGYRLPSRLVESGWLVRIQKGLYEIADLASLGTLTVSPDVAAEILAPGSYVTDENALQHHGLHDQLMSSCFSVCPVQRKPAIVHGTTYYFVKTNEAFFFGFDVVRFAEQTARIAHVEKALLDMLQLQRTDYAVDLGRLDAYLQHATLPTQRIVGFLLETLDLPVAAWLRQRGHASESVTRLTRESRARNATWRLYYDPDLVRRIQSYVA
jgi:predicted transcriptional regulator of viral defense system